MIRISNKKITPGFTLIELLIVIGIIVILGGIVISIINPARQFAMANNSQRQMALNAISKAIAQNVIDNQGLFFCAAGDIPTEPTTMGSGTGQYDICDCLVPVYIAAMPADPQYGYYNSCTDYNTEYTIQKGSVIIAAPHAQLGGTISITLSGEIAIKVPPWSFSLSINPGSGSVRQGRSVSADINAILITGTSQPISLSVSGLPIGATISFSPTNCKPTCSSIMTISTTPATPLGTYPLVITGIGTGMKRTTTYTLEILETKAGWYDPDWSFRKAITIDHTKVGSGGVANFPMLVNLSSDTDLAADAQDDGDDILFTSSDKTTKISHEIENFNGNTGTLVVWVNVPSLSSTEDTTIYMYYGNTSASNQQDIPDGSNDVWDSNYKGVWHLSNGTTLSANDSTSNGRNGAITGSAAATGIINGGWSGDGIDDYVDITMSLGSTITISAWAKWNTGGNADMPWCIDSDNRGPDLFFYGGKISLNTWDSAQNPFCDSPSGLDQWHFYTTVIQPGTGDTKLYFDGSVIGTANYRDPTGSDFHISSSAGYDWQGSIDEVRVSNIARSAAWIAAEFSNQSSPSTFYNVGNEE